MTWTPPSHGPQVARLSAANEGRLVMLVGDLGMRPLMERVLSRREILGGVG